ncbi:MAG: hypothetical protein KAS07_00490, partial [Candidatus Pacebacteria bacterium]|nr:hypothetical protein [Candidatus Paceibacterota bacterium]
EYELAVLKELGERIGYALDVEKVVALVTGSLHQFIEYATVSYILLEKDKVIFKINAEKPVAKKFIQDVRKQMKNALEALIDREVKEEEIEEHVSGAITSEDAPDTVCSYFNIPLVIDEKAVGLLTVSHPKEGQYKEEDMTVLYKIVAQVSQAVTKLEQVVKTEQAKLEAMVESLTDGVMMTDREYNVLVINPTTKKYLRLEDDSRIDIFDCMNNFDGKFDIRGKLEESIVRDKIITTDDVMIHDKFFRVVVSPVKGKSHILKGQILGGVVIFHDMSKEKEVEKLKEEYTSIMIHELRGPLDGIKKMAEFMHEEDVRKNKEMYQQYVQMIFESSSQMLELVNDLLDVARIESGKLTLTPRASKLKQIVAERLNFFAIAAENKHISMEMRCSDEISDELEFDQIRVEQVFNNLLSNAIKYTDEGGEVSVDVFVHTKGSLLSVEAKEFEADWFIGTKEDEQFKKRQDCIIVGVTDTGRGIDSAGLKRLFSKFDKNDIVSQKGREIKVLGIGLVIVKGIVEAHGGVVGVASVKDKGSTFFFTINT